MIDRFEDGLPDQDRALADRLVAERPLPSPMFRGALGRTLARSRPSRPPMLWARVAGCAGMGSAMLGIVTLGVAGTGPFAA